MFAFALWDRNRRTLFLARDRLGIKPVFYARLADGKLLFASELKALLVHPQVPRDVDPQAVEDYFAFGYVPEPRTIFKDVHKLSPGHWLQATQGEGAPRVEEYWDVRFSESGPRTEEEAGEQLVERLREAIRIRLVAEVPLGAFLSGGVDSSAVVALMAGLSEDPVNTCSIAFDHPQYDESDYATQVAQRYRTNHWTGQVAVDDFDLLDRLAGMFDEPFADSSAIPTFRVCELARRSVTVALSGDGGDENLAGYRRYRGHALEERMRSLAPYGLRAPVFGTLARWYPKADWAPRVLRAKSTFQALARDSVAGYFNGIAVVRDDLRERLFSRRLLGELQGYRGVEVLRRHAERAPDYDPVSMVQYLDLKTYLVGDILTKVDRTSMANSLEVRVPILDHELVEWMASLPRALKLREGEGKYLLKRRMEAFLPHDLLYRRKMGFAVPIAAWFRGPLRQRVREALLSERMLSSGLFEPATLERLLGEHERGLRDNSMPMWSLLMFESFLRQTMAQ